MTRLTVAERESFMNIIQADMDAISQKVVEQIKNIWEESRNEILQERGLDLLAERKIELKKKIEELQEEVKKIEDEISFDRLTVHEAIELGAIPTKYDRFAGAHFFGIPVENKLDYDIVLRIKSKIDTEAPAKYLNDLGRSVMREITMAGTFEDAKKAYEDFYSLDFRKYGVDIPPRLLEMKEAKEAGTEHMLGYTSKTTKLLEETKKTTKKKENNNIEVA